MVRGQTRISRSQQHRTRPCNERKDGAPALFVLSVKSKGWAIRPGPARLERVTIVIGVRPLSGRLTTRVSPTDDCWLAADPAGALTPSLTCPQSMRNVPLSLNTNP